MYLACMVGVESDIVGKVEDQQNSVGQLSSSPCNSISACSLEYGILDVLDDSVYQKRFPWTPAREMETDRDGKCENTPHV